MLSCHNLTLQNDLKIVFRNVGFTALPGSLIVIEGSNGSGKSSLLRMITGRITDHGGEITWNKINIFSDIQAFNSNTTYIGHGNALKSELTVLQNLKFWNSLRGLKEMLSPGVSYFNLEEILHTEVGLLSAGWRRKVELTKLLLTSSSLWLLDEPEVNLDAHSRELLLNLVIAKTQSQGVVIVASQGFWKMPFASYVNLEIY